MAVIRREQMAALEEVALQRFEDWMVAHLREHFLCPCERIGEGQVRELIRRGHPRAAKYGFTTEHEVCLYIDLMMMLGSGFDTDPQLPWAARLLHDEEIPSPTRRIDALYDVAVDYLASVVGPDQVFPMDVWQRASGMGFPDPRERLSGGPVAAMIDRFGQFWPRKVEYVGEEALRDLIGQGRTRAAGYGIVSDRGVGAYGAFMFLLGHRYDVDPVQPWALPILQDDEISSETERVDRLIAEARRRLAEAMQ